MKRIIKRITPSGRLAILEKPKKNNRKKCAICGRELNGFGKYTRLEWRRLNLSQKRVTRIYGGYLCHECLEKILKEKARKLNITS